VRPCVSHQANSRSARKDKAKGKANTGSEENSSACLEANSSPLDIQEFLQSYVRAQSWRFGEQRIVADGWIFARYLDKDELLQLAKEDTFPAGSSGLRAKPSFW
jgi:hypothetical protein